MTTFVAGEVLTAAKINGLSTLIASKLVDNTPVNNSTAYVSDADLFLPLAASTTYLGFLHLVYSSNATADFKCQFTFPSGTTLPAWTFTAIDASSVLIHAIANNGGAIGLGGAATDLAYDAWGLVIVGSTAGTLQLQWSQNTANASNTFSRAGSYLTLLKVS